MFQSLKRFWAKIATIARANVSALWLRFSKPQKTVELLVDDMGMQYQEMERAVSSMAAEEAATRNKLSLERDASEEWERKAMIAVEAGRDDLAQQFLEKKIGKDQVAASLQEDLIEQEKSVKGARDRLALMRRKIDRIKTEANMLGARQEAAETKKRMVELQASVMGGITSDSAIAEFEEMRDAVIAEEAEADALAEMNEEFSGTSLEDQFAKLENESVANDALASLKKKMGKHPYDLSAERLKVKLGRQHTNGEVIEESEMEQLERELAV